VGEPRTEPGATHERELIAAVDLCTAGSEQLNALACGWSRHPLHRANLDGALGRNKRWDYWAILAGDTIVSWVYADIDVLGLADVWWADLRRGESGGHAIVVPPDGGVRLPEVPATAPLQVDRDGLCLRITDAPAGSVPGWTRVEARWTERDGRAGRLDATIDLPVGHESLNVVIPWSDELFNYTSKHQARPARGELRVGDTLHAIGDDSDAWGVLDVGRGRWPARIDWNWGGGAGRGRDRDGASHVVGIQIGGKWTGGTGFTENGVIIDGRLTKIGRELEWEYDWKAPLRPWLVRDPGGQLELALAPRYDKHSQTGDDDFGSETHQVFGTWSGHVVDDRGRRIDVDGIQGFAEEARQRW